MIEMPNTLGQLKRAVESMIEASGSEDTLIGSEHDFDRSTVADPEVQLELVFVRKIYDATGFERWHVVGTEANGYKPQPSDRPFVLVR